MQTADTQSERIASLEARIAELEQDKARLISLLKAGLPYLQAEGFIYDRATTEIDHAMQTKSECAS